MDDILEAILATKAHEVRHAEHCFGTEHWRSLATAMPPARGFRRAIESAATTGRCAVIAEIKRASPSAGLLRNPFSPAEIADSYARNGATCLSVLTDREYFQGAGDHLREARAACMLPCLRKDFIVDPLQVFEARVLGADCILLIVAALDAETLEQLASLAHTLGLDVLIEVHNEAELDFALETGASLIGVNNRDLRTFKTSIETSVRLRRLLPHGTRMVSESGIRTRDDVARLRDAGIDAFLVGEAFMRAPDPGGALDELFGAA